MTPNPVAEFSGIIPYASGLHVEVDLRAIRSCRALPHRVAANFPADLPRILLGILLPIVFVRIVEERYVQELFAGASQHRTDGIVDTQQSTFGVRLGNADGGGFIGRGKTLLALVSRALSIVKAGHSRS